MEDARDYFLKWKESMEHFIFEVGKLAKPIVESSMPSSQPASVADEDVERLRQRIDRIRAALADADRVESKSACLKLWQRELRDMEYEAEDIVEEFELQAQRINKLEQLKLELLDRCSVTKRKRELRLLHSRTPFQGLQFKIDQIRERYNDIAFDRNALWMRDEDGQKLQPLHEDRQSSSLISTKTCFTGRHTELKELIDRVVSVKDAPTVITIVGMPGVGKTALAQQVFNSSPVMSLLGERRWWVAMSSAGRDLASVTRSILDAVTFGKALEARNCTNLDVLQRVLTMELKELGENGFLLVLDDARTEMQDFWCTLCKPFNSLSGGKLLVTTQSSKIAREFSEIFQPLHLRPLADNDCLSIIFQHLEGNRDHRKSMEKIIPRCGGLPLAAKILESLVFRQDSVGSEDLEHPNDLQ